MSELFELLLRILVENVAAAAAFLITSGLAITALLYSMRQTRLAKTQIALQQAEIEKQPIIDFGLFKRGAAEETYLLLPLAAQRIVVAELPIHVVNVGDRVARNVALWMEVPDEIYGRDAARVPGAFAVAQQVSHAAEPGQTEHLTRIYLGKWNLPPKANQEVVHDFGFRRDTIINRHFTSNTADGRSVRVDYRVTYSFKVTITLYHDDGPPLSRTYDLHVRTGDWGNIDAFAKQEEDILRGSRRKQERDLATRVEVVTFTEHKFEDLGTDVEGPYKELVRVEHKNIRLEPAIVTRDGDFWIARLHGPQTRQHAERRYHFEVNKSGATVRVDMSGLAHDHQTAEPLRPKPRRR